jgi:hypothetical protein
MLAQPLFQLAHALAHLKQFATQPAQFGQRALQSIVACLVLAMAFLSDTLATA